MITYTLITRELGDSRVGVVLYLFRNDDVASITTIAAVARRAVAELVNKSRAHLQSLGIRDADEHLNPPLRATG